MQITEHTRNRTDTHTPHSERTTDNLLTLTIERGKKPMQESCCLTLPPVVNSYQAWSIETEQQGRQKAENQRASTEIKRAEKWSTFIKSEQGVVEWKKGLTLLIICVYFRLHQTFLASLK